MLVMRPYSRETKKSEENIEAIDRSITWLTRIDQDFEDEIEELRDIKQEEVENHVYEGVESAVKEYVLENEVKENYNLQEINEVLNNIRENMSDNFGFVNEPDLSDSELLWILVKEVDDDIDQKLEEMAEKPEMWSEYPMTPDLLV